MGNLITQTDSGRKILFFFCVLGFSAGICTTVPAYDYELSNEKYRHLALYERSQYDKAKKLFNQGNYQAASKEFQKFKKQFPDSDVIPTIVFMRARSLHKAKERYTAIKRYNETLDFFGWRTKVAGAAMYYKGKAFIQSGDLRKGMQVFRDMAKHDQYSQHPLAANAVRRLGDYYFERDEPDKALKYWKQVANDFADKNKKESRRAKRKALNYHLKQGQFGAISQWLVTDEIEDDPEKRVQVYGSIFGRARRVLRNADQDVKEGFYEYLQGWSEWFEKANAEWSYLRKGLRFATVYTRNKSEVENVLENTAAYINNLEQEKERFKKHQWIVKTLLKGDRIQTAKKYVGKVTSYIKQMKNSEERDQQYAWFVDLLRKHNRYEMAHNFVQRIQKPQLLKFKQHQILGSQGKWKEAAEKLAAIIEMDDREWTKKARKRLARVHHRRTNKRKEAIKLYRQINNPPWTLWQIQDCYKRMGNLKKSLMTLTEIKNMFPDEAPKALWRKAVYHKKAGHKDKAVKHARLILKAHETAQEASKAHQMLEDYGIETGGGVAGQVLE